MQGFSIVLIAISLLLNPYVIQDAHNFVFRVSANIAPQPCSNGICVNQKQSLNGPQSIGISGGNDYFGNKDAIDSEGKIYGYDKQVLNNHDAYYSIVVVSTLSAGDRMRHAGSGADDLEGIVTLMKRADDFSRIDKCGFRMLISPKDCRRLFVYVANAGDSMEFAEQVATQILRLKNADQAHFIGVVGWPLSAPDGITGLRILTGKGIPVISSTASSDALSGLSPYFFRIVPPDSQQGPIAARYAEQQYPDSHTAIIFYDQQFPYSLTLSSAFAEEFTRHPNNSIIFEPYNQCPSCMKTNDDHINDITSKMTDAVGKMQRYSLIFFAGYSEDFSRFLSNLVPQLKNSPVISGDAQYDKKDFIAANSYDVYKNFSFSAFTHPAEWDGVNTKPDEVTAFETTYHSLYPTTAVDLPTENTILTYDAASVLFFAARNSSILAFQNIRSALAKIDQCHPFQAVSGSLAFAPDGNPYQKVILMLTVPSNGIVTLKSINQGNLLADPQFGC
ncbi:hypothetical protein KDW_38300 [Dictyobacter vulcani]|uniref:Uncharacterized protein n=1 Tax=Dictyobacter vulcani TaxID=2607529 RepID=A0A5J4KIY8_9CHLR|nr:hypothetical protein KDW_38300 [Dictyobacter vulcani]